MQDLKLFSEGAEYHRDVTGSGAGLALYLLGTRWLAGFSTTK